MAGKRIDYPLPLVCFPHARKLQNERRGILANFIGRRTHAVRDGVFRFKNAPGFFVSDRILALDSFCAVLNKSVFTLCPRGYGNNSFRICEALQYGSIPVYISDDFVIPHSLDFESYGVLLHSSRIHELEGVLRQIPAEQILALQKKGREVYQQYFTYQANLEIISAHVAR